MAIRMPIALLALPLMPLAGQARPVADRAAIEREVQGRTRAMVQAFEQGDIMAVARFYADDARIYASGTRVEGRSAIDRFRRKIHQPVSWEMETVDLGGSPGRAVSAGSFHAGIGAAAHRDTSYAMCLLVWRRDANGELRIRLDVYANFPEGDFNLSQVRQRFGLQTPGS